MSFDSCCSIGGQLLAVLSKNARVERRHVARFGCELCFPVIVLAALCGMIRLSGDNGFDFLRRDLDPIEIPPQFLPAVYPTDFEKCDGTPSRWDLEVVEPPYDDYPPPCFGHVDGRAIAVQCRCRTLRIAGQPGLRDGFRDFLKEAGVEDLIRDFTVKWRTEKSGSCPERDTFELIDSDDLTVGDDICGVVSFTSASNIAVRVDVTADAAVYRPTLLSASGVLEAAFEANTKCDQLIPMYGPWIPPCVVMYDLYQRHASANLHYLAGLFLAERNPSPAVGSAALSALRPNASLTVYSMPQQTRMVEPRSKQEGVLVLGTFAFMMAFPFVLWVFLIVSALVGEREKRLKEGMRVMGLTDSSFYLSWLLWTLVRTAAVGFLMGLVSLTLTFSARGRVAFCWVCVSGMMYTFAFSAVISVCFSNARTGAMIGTMLYFLLMFPALLPSSLPFVAVLLMCFPSYWLVTGFKHVLYHEVIGWVAGVSLEGFRIGPVIGLGNLVGVLWYLLYLYLEQIVQQSVGQSRGPCFCFGSSFWRETYGKPAPDVENDREELDGQSAL